MVTAWTPNGEQAGSGQVEGRLGAVQHGTGHTSEAVCCSELMLNAVTEVSAAVLRCSVINGPVYVVELGQHLADSALPDIYSPFSVN